MDDLLLGWILGFLSAVALIWANHADHMRPAKGRFR